MSLRLLAIDTTSESGSIAISEGSGVIEEVAIDSPEGFGHILFDEILRLLARQRLKLADMDGFAVSAGPGSFTGVRVGLTAAKGLAEANGKKVAAVSNLQALALFGSRPLRATLIDAHRGQIYGAVYDASLELVCEEIVTPIETWTASLPAGDLEVITYRYAMPLGPHPVIEAPPALAGVIAQIGARQFELGLAQNPALIDANYVRRSDAELLWKDPVAEAARIRK